MMLHHWTGLAALLLLAPPRPAAAAAAADPYDYYTSWPSLLVLAVVGFVVGAALRSLPYYKHLDPLVAIGLYTCLPSLIYIGATAAGVSLATGHAAYALLRIRYIWPYIFFCVWMLCGKYALEGTRRVRRLRRRAQVRQRWARRGSGRGPGEGV